jgi:carbonic anhydrase/acetyltransferase-like protein (isoleucine patch superfamily)
VRTSIVPPGSCPPLPDTPGTSPAVTTPQVITSIHDFAGSLGAVLTAEDGEVRVGARSVVMENALVRGRAGHPSIIGDDVLVGPHAHLNGVRAGDGCFLATGAALFPGSVVGAGAEVRVHGVVQVNTVLPPGATVPVGWVAVGDPARIYPPGEHEQIWAIQESPDFAGTVYGVTRDTPATERMRRQAAWFAAHRDDRLID